MPDIMVILACLSQCLEPTTLRQLGRVIEGDALNQRSRDHERALALERQRGQLPNSPTLIHYALKTEDGCNRSALHPCAVGQ